MGLQCFDDGQNSIRSTTYAVDRQFKF